MSETEASLHVPAQRIPLPSTVSPEARAFLAAAAKRIASAADNAPAGDADPSAFALGILRERAASAAAAIEEIALGPAKLYRVTPAGREGRRAEVAYLDIHGGGFVSGGGEMCKLLAALRASDFGVEVYAVDYRLAPAHPYPAAIEDVMAAYRAVLGRVDAADLVVAGSSAGGNLAAATMLRARAEGLPLPAALLLLTPVTDLTGAGDSRITNRFLDTTLYDSAADVLASYVGGADPTDPDLSPVYGDVTGWPPVLLSTGTRDLLLSDTVRMHRALRRARVAAELHVTEAGPHGGFMGTAPQDRELMAECRRFCETAWGLA